MSVDVGGAPTFVSVSEMLPCVGQAAIGIEIRNDDPRLEAICAQLNHPETLACVTAERAFLSAMGGGCHLAVAAYAQLVGQELVMRGVSYLGARPQRGEAGGSDDQPVQLGERLAASLKI